MNAQLWIAFGGLAAMFAVAFRVRQLNVRYLLCFLTGVVLSQVLRALGVWS